MARKEKLLTATEVCVLVGISVYTLNNWYTFKRLHPRHELSKLLPKPIQANEKGPRYWKRSDVDSIMEFKARRPRGRNGVMGELQPKCRRVKNGKGTNKRRTAGTTEAN